MPRIRSLIKPKLKMTKHTFAERIRSAKFRFAKRLGRIKPAELAEKQQVLFKEIEDSIMESGETMEKSIKRVLLGEKPKIEKSERTDAMFLFLNGFKGGVIDDSEKAREIAEQIRDYSDRLARELKKGKIKHSKEEERSVHYLLYRLASKVKPEKELMSSLIREKREIDERIMKFIEMERKHD